MSIFSNYDNIQDDYIPDNRVRFLSIDNEYKDSIVVGGTSVHYFIMDENFEEEVKDITVYYKQGSEIKLTKTLAEVDATVIEESGKQPYTVVKIELTPVETSLFNDYNKDTTVQMRLLLTTDQVIYTRIYKLYLAKS